jgi:hypothetical protein
MENTGIIYGHLEHLTAIWYTLWPFGILNGYLVYFPSIGKLSEEKSGNPGQDWANFRLLGYCSLWAVFF